MASNLPRLQSGNYEAFDSGEPNKLEVIIEPAEIRWLGPGPCPSGAAGGNSSGQETGIGIKRSCKQYETLETEGNTPLGWSRQNMRDQDERWKPVRDGSFFMR